LLQYPYDDARDRPRQVIGDNRRVPLPFRTAAIGSTNPAKVEAVRRCLGQLAPACAVEPIDVSSGVGALPLGEEAVRAGAKTRALAALERSSADVAFGIEGGVVLGGDYVLLTG